MAGCFCFANPSGFLFGPSQKGTICSSASLDPIFLASSQFSHLITLFEKQKDNKNNLQAHINIQGCLYIQKAMFSKDDAFCVSLSPLLLIVFTPSHKNALNISTISTTQNRLERIAIDLNKLNY
jgi:hypothetical protein